MAYKYKAFISYKNDEYNQKHATALYKALRKYERPSLKMCPIELFLDNYEMSVGAKLTSSIQKALQNSEYLIYLASNKAAKSEWVHEELKYWCDDLQRTDKLIVVLIEGQIERDKPGRINWKETNALPSSIFKKHFQDEFIYEDLSWAKEEENRNIKNPRYNETINKISAKFHGITPIERAGEKSSAYYREKLIKNTTIILLLTLFVGFLLAFFYALHQGNRANEQYKNVQALKLTIEASLETPKDNTKAIRIAEEAYKVLPKPPARTFQALSAAGYSSFKEPFYITTLQHKEAINSALFSPDGQRILTASEDNTAKLCNLQGRLLAELEHKARVTSAVFSPDGSRSVFARWKQDSYRFK
jgi:hypothetical protein